MIQPSIGRVVWYRPPKGSSAISAQGDQPMTAFVVFVWSATCVNLVVFDHRGTHHNVTSVTLAQDRPAEAGECEWMPYQKGQAAKTEAVEAKAQEPNQ